MKNDATNVAVLMAVKNGLAYLPAQIDSILNQHGCQVTLFISDDGSTDGSLHCLQQYAKKANNIKLLPKVKPLGSAAKNFYRLITEVETNGFAYVALSDQDDIWLPDKLSRHIKLAQKHHADGISSNVTAFWPDGRERLLDKAQPQRELDYLFESAGPGCTFLMSPWLIGKMREQLLDGVSPAKEIIYHDLLTYSVCRAYGHKWLIDPAPSVKYRQHQSNELGANVGVGAKWLRLLKLRQSCFRDEVIKLAKVSYKVSANPNIRQLIEILKNKNFSSQIRLLLLLPKTRRKTSDRLMLAGAILLGLF